MSCKVTHCTRHVSANTRPHQLHWGDQEMGTAVLCMKCSQVAGLIQKVSRCFSKAPSICAAVLQLKVDRNDHNCHVCIALMWALALKISNICVMSCAIYNAGLSVASLNAPVKNISKLFFELKLVTDNLLFI